MRILTTIFLSACVFILPSLSLHAQPSKCLFRMEKKHHFSSMKRQDTFVLTVTGQDVIYSSVTLKILRWDGKQIYKHHFTSGEMMEYGPKDIDKYHPDSLSVIKHLSHFFDEASFRFPAIPDTNDYSASMRDFSISYEEWLSILKDKTSIGFNYILGAEDGYTIAYSKRYKKVVIYFKCC